MENPKELSLEVSRVCNLNCITCPRNRNQGEPYHLLPETLQDILDRVGLPDRVNLIGGGEPLLNPYLDKILEILRNTKVVITTNGMLVNDEVAKKWKDLGVWKIYVSLDSLKQELLDKLRPGASVGKIIEAIKILINAGLDVKINFLIYRSNFYELMDFAKLCKELKVSRLYIITPKYSKDEEDNPIWGRPPYYEEDILYINMFKDWCAKNGVKTSESPFPLPTFSEYFCKNHVFISIEGDIYTCAFVFLQGYGKEVFEEYYYGDSVRVNLKDFCLGSIYENGWKEKYEKFNSYLDTIKRKEGTTISIEELKELRRQSYCEGCLVRWRQSCEV